MAKGGKRTYARDGNGRFASSSGGRSAKAPASKQLSKPKGTVDSPGGFSPKSSPLAKSKRQSAQASYKRTAKRLLAERANERAGKKTLKDRILAPIARRIGKVKKMFGR